MISDRYAPDVPFPPYAFVPGKHPHPVTDPRGHSFGFLHEIPEPLDPSDPFASRPYLEAIDLFNAGFYWEAHEAWESLWIAAGRAGVIADFLKGLIKLAAAGVKARESQPVGVQRHARRAAELFRRLHSHQASHEEQFAGLTINELIQIADALAEEPAVDATASTEGRVVIACRLTLSN